MGEFVYWVWETKCLLGGKKLTRRKQFLGKELLLGKPAVPIEELKEDPNTTTRPMSSLFRYCEWQTRRCFTCTIVHFFPMLSKSLLQNAKAEEKKTFQPQSSNLHGNPTKITPKIFQNQFSIVEMQHKQINHFLCVKCTFFFTHISSKVTSKQKIKKPKTQKRKNKEK